MSFSIDLVEHGPELKHEYESVISSDPESVWTIFGYDGSSNALKPVEGGSVDLDEFVEAFDDSKILYGLARVEFNSVNKVVLVGWVGENVSSRQRLVFNAHMAAVAKKFPGHHIQVTARGSDELSPSIILDRVSAAAGSKYASGGKPAPASKPKYVLAAQGANEDDWEGTAPVAESDLKSRGGSDYKSSVRAELEQFKKKQGKLPPTKLDKEKDDDEEEEEEKPKNGKSFAQKVSKKVEDEDEDNKPSSGISGLNSGTSYTPVGKIDLKKIRAEAKNSKFADSRIEKIESSYKPVGKVDLKTIREQARKEKELRAKHHDEPQPSKSAESTASADNDDEDEEPTKKVVSKKVESKKVEPKRAEPKAESKLRSSLFEADEESGAGQSQCCSYQKSSLSQHKGGKSTYGGDDEEEPQFLSLKDRMKAFQDNVSGAKPKFDDSSRSVSHTQPKKFESRSEAKSEPKKSESTKSVHDDEDEDENGYETVSVAAHLAKARLNKTEDEEVKPVKKNVSYNATVSTFAARFAKKTKPEDDEVPALAARRAPVSTPTVSTPPAAAAAVPPPAASARKEESSKAQAPDDDIIALVIHAYDAEDDDELALKEGEKIFNIQKVDENWWLGENGKGDTGMFPADYVEEQKGGASAAIPSLPRRQPAPPAEEEDEDVPPPASHGGKSKGTTAISQYGYEKGDEDELGFEDGELIIEIDFASDEWWSGTNAKGETGLFPASYVELQ